MVIDDEPTILKTLQVGLMKEEVETTCFGVPEKALEEFKLNYSRYQAIITDYMMPKIDGQEVIKILREIEVEFGLDQPDIPIIVLTAQGGTNVAVELLKSGATDYIEKPVVSHALLAHRLEICIEAEQAKYSKRKKKTLT